jgi:GNAT superfamily N-acetyltransferase
MAVGPEGARLARPDDTARLAQLAAALTAELGAARGGATLARFLDPLLTEASLRRRIADTDRGAVVVGTYDDTVAGLALVQHPRQKATGGTPEGHVAVVHVLYVEPGMREVGIGGAILAELVRLEADRGATALDVPALPGDGTTKSFLEGAGFRARLLVMHRPLRMVPDP